MFGNVFRTQGDEMTERTVAHFAETLEEDIPIEGTRFLGIVYDEDDKLGIAIVATVNTEAEPVRRLQVSGYTVVNDALIQLNLSHDYEDAGSLPTLVETSQTAMSQLIAAN